MKYSEISNLKVQELRKRLEQNRQALFTARMKHKMQRLSNMMDLRNIRRDIARLETALSALPESAFVSEKKPEKAKKELSSAAGKTGKATKEKTKQLHKKDKPQKDKLADPVKDTSLTMKKAEAKAERKTKKTGAKKAEDKSPVQDKHTQQKTKTKKWFGGIFGSKQKSSRDMKSVGKKSFFRRKSG